MSRRLAALVVPEDAFIRAGYSANAQIVLKRVENVLTIPESTVEFKGDSTFVYLLKASSPKQVFEKKAVEIGLSDGINIEIKNGLTTEDKIQGAVVQKN